MRSRSGKQVVLLVIFLAMLGGLAYWINNAGGAGGDAPAKPTSVPVMDESVLAKRWPDVVAHAAAPARGKASARYTLAEFGDFQCPQCGKVRPLLESLLKQYPDQVNLIFVHRPFPTIHKYAVSAGQAAEAAAAQGKFWAMYDVLYRHQDDLEPGFYDKYAVEAGLNKAQFQSALNSGQGMDTIKADSALADALAVHSTPTILLHDNQSKTVKVYIGITGTKNTDGTVQYPGTEDLAAHPPWKGS